MAQTFLFRYGIERREANRLTRRYLCMVLEGLSREEVQNLVRDWTHGGFPRTIVPEGWAYIAQTEPVQDLTC